MAVPKIGDEAPDFELTGVIGNRREKFKLSDYRGKKNVVLAFYAADFSPGCAIQMPGYQSQLAKFAAADAQLVGISPDTSFSHIAWQKFEIGSLDYPLLSDFYPHGEVARKYGVFREGPPLPGISERAIFVVDKAGKIAFAKVYELHDHPPAEEVLAALAKLDEKS